LYAYVSNNPITKADPLGLLPEDYLPGGPGDFISTDTVAHIYAIYDLYTSLPAMPYNNIILAIQNLLAGDFGAALWEFLWDRRQLPGAIRDFMEQTRPINPDACPGSGDYWLNLEKILGDRPGAYRAPNSGIFDGFDGGGLYITPNGSPSVNFGGIGHRW
jgi:hypothetical protein